VELLGRVALLADRLGVSQSTVLAWLSGNDVPSPRLFHKMLDILQAAETR
jgi:transcriptional regulator with XRE-family HTH domain